MSKNKIINFEDARLKNDISITVNKLRKIYKDIEIQINLIPNYFLEVWFYKDKYCRGERLSIDELKYYDLEKLLKFRLNNFCYEVYEKIEEEIKKEKTNSKHFRFLN